MLNFKSVLYKRKYYAISFKLNFLLKSNLFKEENKLYNIRHSRDIFNFTIRNTHDKFILNRLIFHNNNSSMIYYTLYGRIHRNNKPAYLNYYNNRLITEKYYQFNLLHREDGPAIIKYYSNGKIECEEYYIDGEQHREDGPAEIEYYENGNVKCEHYYINGSYYREDGPDYIEYDKEGKIIFSE